MKEELEDFVRKNRNAFDDKEPSEKVWRNIEASTSFRKNSLWNSVMVWRAAAMLFMALSIYLLVPKITGSTSRHQELALKEFTDVEQFYFQQISEKTELIQEFPRNEGLNGFTNDFKQLEAMYQVLKDEMKSRPSQKVKDALVLNLLVRIDLLNQQLQKLEEGNEVEEEEKESEPSKNV